MNRRTDVKNNNIDALKYISSTAGELKKQFIPQIYTLNEFAPVRQLNFKDIILTLYRLNLSDEKILEFVGKNKVFAVTMPFEQAISTSLANSLKEKDVFVYAHTINSPNVLEKLQKKGVSGIYTDFLVLNYAAKKKN